MSDDVHEVLQGAVTTANDAMATLVAAELGGVEDDTCVFAGNKVVEELTLDELRAVVNSLLQTMGTLLPMPQGGSGGCGIVRSVD